MSQLFRRRDEAYVPSQKDSNDQRHGARQEGKPDAARELLDDVWELAERGPYPLFHADAFNVLAQIERDAGNLDKAIEAATRAYRLAWCDGPPYAYH